MWSVLQTGSRIWEVFWRTLFQIAVVVFNFIHRCGFDVIPGFFSACCRVLITIWQVLFLITDIVYQLLQKSTSELFPLYPEDGAVDEYKILLLFFIRDVAYYISFTSYICSVVALFESHAIKKFYNKALAGQLLNFSDAGAKVLLVCIVQVAWILYNLLVCVIQHLDITEKRKKDKCFCPGFLICTLKTFCSSNLAVVSVFLTFFFDKDDDLMYLYSLYTHVLFMNIGKMRFDDCYLLDCIIGMILNVHLSRAWFLYLPMKCCNEMPSEGPFDFFFTLKISYLLVSRLLIYYCLDYFFLSKNKKEFPQRARAPGRRH